MPIDFPDTPIEFPVPSRREITRKALLIQQFTEVITAEMDLIRQNSLYFPCITGNFMRDELARDCQHHHPVRRNWRYLQQVMETGGLPPIQVSFPLQHRGRPYMTMPCRRKRSNLSTRLAQKQPRIDHRRANFGESHHLQTFV
jgi:hypothetical protein